MEQNKEAGTKLPSKKHFATFAQFRKNAIRGSFLEKQFFAQSESWPSKPIK